MSGREKIERDFKTFNEEIEKLGKKETQTLRERIETVKKQAEKVGEAAERSLIKREKR